MLYQANKIRTPQFFGPFYFWMFCGAPEDHDACLDAWANKTKAYVDTELLKFLRERQSKVAFQIPSDVMLIPALEITSAASDAQLSSFREVMNYDNLMRAFSHSGQYDVAGTIWMLDATSVDSQADSITISQIQSTMQLWSEETFVLSASKASLRRFSFDVPLPAKVVDTQVAQRREMTNTAVVMAQPLPMIAGRVMVMTWYGAIAKALRDGNEDRAFKLFEAALSVPIRLRLCPDGDACHLASLLFSETLFAAAAASGADSFWKFAEKAGKLSNVSNAINKNLSIPRLSAELKAYGLTFKGKQITDGNVRALKSLVPFVEESICGAAFSLAEVFCPELRDATMLMRIAQLSLARVGSTEEKLASARSFVLVLDCLRVFRLTGEEKGETYTVNKVSGQEKKTPGMVHVIFKRQDVVDFVLHEVELLSRELLASVEMFRTPLALVKRFAASGAKGLAAAYRFENSNTPDGLENLLALPVAIYRDDEIHDAKTRALIDFLWALQSRAFDDEILELCNQNMLGNTTNFLWHRYLNESSQGMGLKYRAFVDACTKGPIPQESRGGGLIGTSELTESDQQDLKKTQELLKNLRRKTVTFVALPSIGGASGADYTKAQMDKLWESMRFGHTYSRKKNRRSRFRSVSRPFPPERGQARSVDEHE